MKRGIKFVTLDLNESEATYVGQVLHLLSLQYENVIGVPDAIPAAAMKDGPPSPGFTTTPALPCRERSIRLGGSALGEVTGSTGCVDPAGDRVLGILLF